MQSVVLFVYITIFLIKSQCKSMNLSLVFRHIWGGRSNPPLLISYKYAHICAYPTVRLKSVKGIYKKFLQAKFFCRHSLDRFIFLVYALRAEGGTRSKLHEPPSPLRAYTKKTAYYIEIYIIYTSGGNTEQAPPSVLTIIIYVLLRLYVYAVYYLQSVRHPSAFSDFFR